MADTTDETTTKIEEIEKRRAERKAATQRARDDQYAKDLEALDELEASHGDENVSRLAVNGFRPGLPTFVVVRVPTDVEYKRFSQTVRRAKDNNEAKAQAVEQLGAVCLVYPSKDDEETRKALLSAFPGIIPSAGVEATRLAEAQRETEGKG